MGIDGLAVDEDDDDALCGMRLAWSLNRDWGYDDNLRAGELWLSRRGMAWHGLL